MRSEIGDDAAPRVGFASPEQASVSRTNDRMPSAGKMSQTTTGRLLKGRPEQRRNEQLRKRHSSIVREASVLMSKHDQRHRFGRLRETIIRAAYRVVVGSDGLETIEGRDGLNEVLGAYLSAVGIVFGLLVAQVYAASSKRTELMRELVTSEAGCMHRAFLLVDALQEVIQLTEAGGGGGGGAAGTAGGEANAGLPRRVSNGLPVVAQCSAMNSALEKYAQALQHEYANRQRLRWNEEAVRERRVADSALLYKVISSASVASHLAGADDPAALTLTARLVETTEELITLRYRRSGEQQQQILTLTLNCELWLMCVCLYLGVLLLDTGSHAIDLALALATVVTMVLSLWTVAVMDLPFAGAAQVRFSDLCVVPEEMVRKALRDAPSARSRRLNTSSRSRQSMLVRSVVTDELSVERELKTKVRCHHDAARLRQSHAHAHRSPSPSLKGIRGIGTLRAVFRVSNCLRSRNSSSDAGAGDAGAGDVGAGVGGSGDGRGDGGGDGGSGDGGGGGGGDGDDRMRMRGGGGAARRSQRQRFRPLEYWRGERMVYGRDESCPFEAIVDCIVVAED
jgi:hypothetical protein